MSIYLLLYLTVVVMLLHIGYLAYRKYNNFLYGKYLIAATLCFAAWVILYLIAFSTTFESEILLILSRILYNLSMIGMYCMLFFAYFFCTRKKIKKKRNNIIILLLGLITTTTVFSPFVIKGMIFNETLGFNYEEFGILFSIYAILYILNPIAFIIIARKKISQLKGISKIRFKYICIGYLVFLLNWMFFLGVLPMLDIWIMQKEQILFFIPFILMVYYSIHRYYFLDLFVGLGRSFIFINALLFASLSTDKIYNHYTDKIGSTFEVFWGIEDDFGVIHIILGMTLFIVTYKFLSNKLLIGTTHDDFVEKLEKMKAKIPFITNINDLNIFLRNSFNTSISITGAKIILFDVKEKKKSELYNFFEGNIKNRYFLNDVTYIEENKHKFDKKKLKNEIEKTSSLIFPIKRSKGEIIGVFSLGHKPLKDVYRSKQIQELEKFTRFLTGHIKYLDMYTDIHELNVNLDKKVDEKTMEYNNLISKQKEFISVVSHEMRSPITTAIFQTDCILDDIEAGKIKKEHLEQEVSQLYAQLTRSSDLVKKLFSVEKYDINKFSLFKEKVDLYDFLKKEIYHFTKNHPGVEFDINMEKQLGEIEIDQVQFRQVIDNLINNAIKFADKENPKISFSAEKKKSCLSIKIEDNGKGFEDTDISSVFDKYFTGKSSSIGIGIGLYLCKKIVEFHEGKIEAKFSKKLGGGKFIITLPK